MRVRLLLIFLVLLLDQGTKYFFGGQLNQGVSFSFLQISPMILVAMQLALLFIIARMMRFNICAGLILGGGISNLVDRVVFGGVRDWMTLPGLGLHNNLADWAIVIGLICFVIVQYRDDFTSTSHTF